MYIQDSLESAENDLINKAQTIDDFYKSFTE